LPVVSGVQLTIRGSAPPVSVEAKSQSTPVGPSGSAAFTASEKETTSPEARVKFT
jgi:hypothetical protein